MHTRKGLVIDNQNYFPRLLKNKFKEHISFDSHRNFKYLDKVLNHYSIIVFVIYSEDEIFDCMKVCNKGIPLIICTFNKERLIKLRRIENIMLLDSSRILPEIVTQLKSYFNHMNLLS